MIYVMIIDDEDDFRNGLEVIINAAEDLKCVGSYRDCETALKNLQEDVPDVILLDIELPRMRGIEGAYEIKKTLPDAEIIMLTIREDDDAIFESLRNGAVGYLVKNVNNAVLLQAIYDAHAGAAPMTPSIARRVLEYFRRKHTLDTLTVKEREVLRYLLQGKSYKAIATTMYISRNTVKFHIKNIYRKLQVHSWPELANLLMREKGL